MRISVGVDVAKEVHWVCAVDPDAHVLFSRAVNNTQADLDAFVADLKRLSGEVVVGLDVMGSIATFLQAALLSEGVALVHLPGLAVNRARAGFAGGEHKSDPRDARVIAEQVRTRPELRPIKPDDEATITLRLLVGRRRDLIEDQTRRISRMRQLVSAIHPGLERNLDFTTKAALWLLTRYVSPSEIRSAGTTRLVKHLRRRPNLRNPERLAETALAQAREQHLAVPGERPTADLVRELALEALAVSDRLDRIDKQLEVTVGAHPDGALIRTMPGMGAILSAELIAIAGDLSRFRSPDALAAAAGLAPVLRQSGKSRAIRRAFGGDKHLKRVFFMSAFCAVSIKDPLSTAFYERKRREGKHRTQALIALARRRATVLWVMLQTHSAFDQNHRAAA
jgi:transposase